MNDTNRALNRAVVALVGVAALAGSAAAVLLLVAPSFGRQWTTLGRQALSTADDLFARPLWPGTTVSAAAVVLLALAVIGVVLLVTFILRRGHGGTSTVVQTRTDDGSVGIDTAVPAALIADRLGAVPGVAGVTVSAYRVRRTPALKVTVRCRRGASPRTITDALDDTVERLHAALGLPIPVFAQLVGGFRSRLRSPVRVDTAPSAGAVLPS